MPRFNCKHTAKNEERMDLNLKRVTICYGRNIQLLNNRRSITQSLTMEFADLKKQTLRGREREDI